MDLIFANGITLEDINRYEAALKNEYMDNLVSTGLSILPVIDQNLSGKQIKIKEGFIPKALLLDLHDVLTHSMISHTKGLALKFTWTNYDYEEAYFLAHALYEYAEKNDLNFHIVILEKEDAIDVHRKSSKLQIVTKLKKTDKYKIIKEKKD